MTDKKELNLEELDEVAGGMNPGHTPEEIARYEKALKEYPTAVQSNTPDNRPDSGLKFSNN